MDFAQLYAVAHRHNLVGFNGQIQRTRFLEWLFREAACTSFAETGTHLGATALLAASMFSTRVFTVELRLAYHLFARGLATLARQGRVNFERGDSRAALTRWLRSGALGTRPMIYLDAHWYEDMPLLAEIRGCVAQGSCIVIVDDCRVDRYPGYGFDSIEMADGSKFVVALEDLAAVLGDGVIHAFQPATAVESETGFRRGAAVLLIGVDPPSPITDRFAASLFEEVPLPATPHPAQHSDSPELRRA